MTTFELGDIRQLTEILLRITACGVHQPHEFVPRIVWPWQADLVDILSERVCRICGRSE